MASRPIELWSRTVVVGLAVLVVLVVCAYPNVRGRRAQGRVDPDRWAGRHGFAVTDASRAWIGHYLRVRRDLRQVCGLGGVVIADAVTAAIGIHVSGLLWVLAGCAAGIVGAEVTLTRLPRGVTRSVSPETRRVRDHVDRRLLLAQGWAFAVSVTVAAITIAFHRTVDPVDPVDPGGDGAARATHAMAGPSPFTDLFVNAMAAIGVAVAISLVVFVAQRHVVRRDRPPDDAHLTTADDVLRSSAAHALSATAVVTVCLLVAVQCSYLVAAWIGTEPTWVAIAAPVVVAGSALTLVALRARRHPWQARTSIEPEGSGDGAPLLTGRRSPVPAVVGLIGLATMAGWAVHVWGPVNPILSVRLHGPPISAGTWSDVEGEIRNESMSPVELVGVTLVGGSGLDAGDEVHGFHPRVIVGVSDRDTYWSLDDDLATGPPVTLPGRSSSAVTVAMLPRISECPARRTAADPRWARLAFRTSSGRVVDHFVRIWSESPPRCAPPLPRGDPPDDPVAAEEAVRAAVAGAYDPPHDSTTLEHISDPRGVAETRVVARAGDLGHLSSPRAYVEAVSFDTPNHAWFLYQLSTGINYRKGEAMLIDGRWKVARDTICKDIAITGADCPPLPQ